MTNNIAVRGRYAVAGSAASSAVCYASVELGFPLSVRLIRGINLRWRRSWLTQTLTAREAGCDVHLAQLHDSGGCAWRAFHRATLRGTGSLFVSGGCGRFFTRRVKSGAAGEASQRSTACPPSGNQYRNDDGEELNSCHRNLHNAPQGEHQRILASQSAAEHQIPAVSIDFASRHLVTLKDSKPPCSNRSSSVIALWRHRSGPRFVGRAATDADHPTTDMITRQRVLL